MDDSSEHEERQARLPVVTAAGERGGMLPGIAGICLYLLLMTMLNAFSAARGVFGNGTARYSILAACSLVLVGVFGLLRLLRWGWALVIAACGVLSGLYFYGAEKTHSGPYVIQGLFSLVFFLYLSRAEVRERLR